MKEDKRFGEILFVIAGPSGAGKGRIIRDLVKWNPALVRCRNWTNRPLRKDERDGEEYIYVTAGDLSAMREREEIVNGCVPQYGFLYAIRLTEIRRIWSDRRLPIVEANYNRIEQLKAKLSDVVTIFISVPSVAILEQRLRKRNRDGDEEIALRLEESTRMLGDISPSLVDYCVVNEDFVSCARVVRSIVVAELHRLRGSF